MTDAIIEQKMYQYEIEVGHSKSGSDHVIVIKSLKVRGDDLLYAIQEVQSALVAFREMID
tara:strand:- start:1667 stop:1846 length:180 start_codon:yes stop_codon:yes gene_type:complete